MPLYVRRVGRAGAHAKRRRPARPAVRLLRRDVLQPVVVRLGDDGDDAFDLVLQLVVLAGRDVEQVVLAASVDVLEDDRGAEPGCHLAALATYWQPTVR